MPVTPTTHPPHQGFDTGRLRARRARERAALLRAQVGEFLSWVDGLEPDG